MRCWYRARSWTSSGASPLETSPSLVHRSMAERSDRVVASSAGASRSGALGIHASGWGTRLDRWGQAQTASGEVVASDEEAARGESPGSRRASARPQEAATTDR